MPPVTIAAGKTGERLRFETTLKTATAVTALWPRLGPGAKSIEVTAFRPDAVVEPLLWLNNYRAEWPTSYILKDAIDLPAGTRLVVTAYYDNASQSALAAKPALSVTGLPPSRPAATLAP
jgi:hypothetical protein